MPLRNRTTLTQYLIEERRRFPGSSGDFNSLILDVALACKAIARSVAMGELGGMYGDQAGAAGAAVNVRGETQKKFGCAERRTVYSHEPMGRPFGGYGIRRTTGVSTRLDV